MKRFLVLIFLSVAIVTGQASSQDSKSLARLTVPDDDAAALKTVQEWLDARGLDSEVGNGVIIFRKESVVFSILPIVAKKGLDRLLISSFYNPKDEFKGSKELKEFAMEANRSENFLRVFVTKQEQFGTSSSLTFYDELSSHEFDAFIELYAGVLRKYVLTPDAVKMLK